jgi:hypothetical protein
MKTTDGMIYLASNRERLDMETHRSLRTITRNKPFNNLSDLWDDTLAGGETRHFVSKGTRMLLPLVGDIITSRRLSPGQAQMVNDTLLIENPHKDNLINYLYLSFSSPLPDAIAEFDLDKNRNSLVTLFPSVFLGKYDGRVDDVFKLDKETSGVFVFVIEGAFEVQNRLLQPRDGLALWNVDEVEFVALSNEAIVLVLLCSRLTTSLRAPGSL